MSHLRLRLCVCLGALLALVATGNAMAASNVVISQVYGGGGNSGATLTNDFIELHNRTAAPIDLTGWSVQYASVTGTTWQVTALTGTIAAGGYYLVQEAAGTGGTVNLPTPDATGSIAMSGTNGKVVLVASSATLSGACPSGLIDVVGYGPTASCSETTPTPLTSNTTAAVRLNNGCTDTDNNSADFAIAAPTPRNSASAADTCGADNAPSVASTVPTSGATGVSTGATITVSFSEPVNVTDPWYTISCPISGNHSATVSGGPTSFTLDPILDFAAGETCSVSIAAASVSDQDALDPPDNMAANAGFTFTTMAPPTGAPVVVSEVYGGGGNSGATLTNDFIELFNRTGASVDLTGWSVQYASSAGTTWSVTPLIGSIEPGRNYLIQEAAGAGGTTPLPAPDATGSIAMSGTAGKVALVESTTPLSGACPVGAPIVDFVGYGAAANCSETAPTATLSNTTSAQRKDGGAQDTNNNSADFTVAAPDPHSGPDKAPKVSATTPAAGATDVAREANVAITFSEPVDVTDGWYSISCATSGAHAASVTGGPVTFTLDPATNFVGDELCTVTVSAANVTDTDTDDPPNGMTENHVFTFRTIDAFTCGDDATLIHEIQGSGTSAALTGSRTIEGVVTFDSQATGQFGGYFVQEEVADQDSNPLTSEGIFVFSGSGVDNVSVGQVVRVRGTAGEAFGMTQLSSISALAQCGSGSVPATPVSLPVANVGDHEAFEGMLVSYSQTLTATEVFNLGRFGEVSLSGTGRLYNTTAVAAPGAPAEAVAAQNARSRIILDDANNLQNIDPTLYPQGGLSATNTLRVGDSLNGLTGILEFRFSNYRIQPVGDVNFDHTNLRTPAPAAVGGNLKVASFNVLNYFNDFGCGDPCRGAENQFEFDRQEAKIVSALKAIDADVVGLMEIENDGGAGNALAELVAALNAATAPGTYAFIDTGVIGTDAIKVALIYKPAAVTPVGAWDILTTADDPRFIDTRNRPALAQTFRHTSSGQVLTVAVNHLKSKGSACGGAPDDQPDTGGGNCNGTRTAAAAALADWLQADPTGSGDPDFLIIGDLNSYTFETPITTLEADGFTNLVRKYHGLAAYSYVFNGESGYLDHALATSSLSAQVTGVSDWHINPDEPTVLDYNTNFKSANHVITLYDQGPYRASDHDPVIIGVQLNHAPTVDAGAYSVPEGSSVTVTASGSDADGDTLTYAWDLDNDGQFDDATVQSASFSAALIDGTTTRTIRVEVTDGEASTVDEATVTVNNVAPTATFNAPASGFAGFSFTLSLTNPGDAAPADVAGLTYAFDCGAGYGLFSSSSTATCPTNSTGTRSVGGKVRDDDGGETEYPGTVVIRVTYASLCALVRSYVDDTDIADSLCTKLAAAEASAARGNEKAKRAMLASFVKQVEAQSGKSMTAAEAATLIDLAKEL